MLITFIFRFAVTILVMSLAIAAALWLSSCSLMEGLRQTDPRYRPFSSPFAREEKRDAAVALQLIQGMEVPSR